MIVVAKTVDSYRFLDGVAKRVMKRWAGLPGETQVPWTPLAKPLPKCTVSLVSSAAIALKTDHPFDPEIERRDPWFSDPSYRVVPRTARTGDVQVCHLHINPHFAEQDLNSVLPAERLDELAELAGVYCEGSKSTNAGPLSSDTCRDLCRITYPKWGNTHPANYSPGYAAGWAAFVDFGVVWVEPFAVNSR